MVILFDGENRSTERNHRLLDVTDKPANNVETITTLYPNCSIGYCNDKTPIQHRYNMYTTYTGFDEFKHKSYISKITSDDMSYRCLINTIFF